MDERNYPGKVEVEMPLQLKTESPANQVVIKVPLIKSNNIFSFLEKEWGRTFYQSGLWCKKKKQNSYNGLKETTSQNTMNNLFTNFISKNII